MNQPTPSTINITIIVKLYLDEKTVYIIETVMIYVIKVVRIRLMVVVW